MAWRFVRRGDGLSYDFVLEKDTQFDHPSYRRADFDVYCRRLPDFGWCVVDPDGRVLSRPVDDAGFGELPPTGAWLSGKGERAYVYDLVEVPERWWRPGQDEMSSTPTVSRPPNWGERQRVIV